MNTEQEQLIVRHIQELFDAGNVSARVSIVGSGGEACMVMCEISDDAGQFIGRAGENLEALEHIIRIMANRIAGAPIKLSVDVNNYRERRAMEVRERARAAADAVRVRQTPEELEPMNSFERRIVHLELAGRGDVMTESVGEGLYRRVVIKPAL